MKYDVILKELK